MEKKSYSELLRHPHWQRKKTEILKRDKFKCKLCGDDETTLHVHHKEYINGNNPWDYPNDLLITLCEHCHYEVSLEKNKKIDIKNISIYKSNNWQNGDRIMFVVENKSGFCSMRVYNSKDQFIKGYNLDPFEIQMILKILRKSQ